MSNIFEERDDWITEPGAVRLQQTGDGGWDVVVRLDGTYYHYSDAQRIAAHFSKRIQCEYGE
jgi:hypothetical protein